MIPIFHVKTIERHAEHAIFTLPVGNFLRKAADLFVSPKTKSDATLTLAPEYSAAIRALYARKFSGYVYNVCKYENAQLIN